MPVQIGNKDYYTVAERLRLANGEGYEPPKKIVNITTSLERAGDLVAVVAHVSFEDGSHYSGMSMINSDSRSRVEANAPLETAETSAVGRALAFAGYYGSPDGIAGYEEILLAQEREKHRGQAAEPRPAPRYADESGPYTRMGSGASPRPAGNPGGPSPAQVRFANQLWADSGQPMPPPDWAAMSSRDVSAKIDELKGGGRR